jgi:hypothetical protein
MPSLIVETTSVIGNGSLDVSLLRVLDTLDSCRLNRPSALIYSSTVVIWAGAGTRAIDAPPSGRTPPPAREKGKL